MDEFNIVRKVSVVSSIISEEKSRTKQNGLKGDYLNVCMLILLYALQAIPMGLMSTIPMIFSANKVPYASQAIFSFASYPYIMKLLWAPIADSVYSKRFGRRKSWIVPSQYLIGAGMIAMAPFSKQLIGDENNAPQIYLLTTLIFLIVIFVTCQDVATDGWGLTLLARRNVHYVASSETVGWNLGAFLSTTVFLSLESPKFCNQWLRSEPKEYGIVNIEQLFYAIGFFYLFSTTIICFFKKEEKINTEEETLDMFQTYKLLLKVIRLKSILIYVLMHMTMYVGNGVFWAATDLKLIQYGVRREILSLLKTPIAMLNLALPFIIVHKTKHNPLHYFWHFGVMRIIVQSSCLLILYWTQSFNQPKEGEFPWFYYAVLFILLVIIDVLGYISSMACWSFITSVAHPHFGATYMTLFTTIANIGVKSAITASLALLDPLTIEESEAIRLNSLIAPSTNVTMVNTIQTSEIKMDKNIIVDGFYIQGVFCTIYGVVWFKLFKKIIWDMQRWPEANWRLKKRVKENEEELPEVRQKLNSVEEKV